MFVSFFTFGVAVVSFRLFDLFALFRIPTINHLYTQFLNQCFPRKSVAHLFVVISILLLFPLMDYHYRTHIFYAFHFLFSTNYVYCLTI